MLFGNRSVSPAWVADFTPKAALEVTEDTVVVDYLFTYWRGIEVAWQRKAARIVAGLFLVATGVQRLRSAAALKSVISNRMLLASRAKDPPEPFSQLLAITFGAQ